MFEYQRYVFWKRVQRFSRERANRLLTKAENRLRALHEGKK